jgi:hypothetical protein
MSTFHEAKVTLTVGAPHRQPRLRMPALVMSLIYRMTLSRVKTRSPGLKVRGWHSVELQGSV